MRKEIQDSVSKGILSAFTPAASARATEGAPQKVPQMVISEEPDGSTAGLVALVVFFILLARYSKPRPGSAYSPQGNGILPEKIPPLISGVTPPPQKNDYNR